MEVPVVMMTDVDNDMEKVDFSGRNPTIDGTGIFSGSQFTTHIFFALFWAIFQCQCALLWPVPCLQRVLFAVDRVLQIFSAPVFCVVMPKRIKETRPKLLGGFFPLRGGGVSPLSAKGFLAK